MEAPHVYRRIACAWTCFTFQHLEKGEVQMEIEKAKELRDLIHTYDKFKEIERILNNYDSIIGLQFHTSYNDNRGAGCSQSIVAPKEIRDIVRNYIDTKLLSIRKEIEDF